MPWRYKDGVVIVSDIGQWRRVQGRHPQRRCHHDVQQCRVENGKQFGELVDKAQADTVVAGAGPT